MKINLILVPFFFVFNFMICLQVEAQTNGVATNTFLLGPNDVMDFTAQGQEKGYYTRNVSLHHTVHS